MKKFYSILMVALAATLAFSSCKKDNGGKGGEEETSKVTARLLQMGGYVFSYDADGKVSKVAETWDNGDGTIGSYDLNFVYNGSSLNINDSEGTVYKVTLNAKGLAEKVEIVGDAVYTYTYDANNFCITCKKDGVDVCQQSIDDMCVEYWTRVNTKEDAETRPFRHKEHTYSSTPNTCGVHTEWAEDFGQKRWFYETGLLGRASAKICKTAQWDDSEKFAEYTYVYDDNGYVTKETKMYGAAGALEFDDEKTFVWEKLN